VGLYALGMCDDIVTSICQRVALDSMPVARRGVLEAIWRQPESTTSTVARAADIDRGVVRRNLEELEVVGVVEGVREGEEPAEFDPDRRPALWTLAGENAELFAQVFDVYYSSVELCLEKMDPHTQTPSDQGVRDDQDQHLVDPLGVHPSFRNTPPVDNS
jgi:DNA-binding MarR family transcriptional regulator